MNLNQDGMMGAADALENCASRTAVGAEIDHPRGVPRTVASRSVRPTEEPIQPTEETQTATNPAPTRFIPASVSLRGAPLLDLDQPINMRFRNEQVLAVHLRHHKPTLVQNDQTPRSVCACPRPSVYITRNVLLSTFAPPTPLLILALARVPLRMVQASLLPVVITSVPFRFATVS
jgi:hypothetical protein